MSKYFSILRINWINALEYRGNALIGLFAILSGLFIEYQIWSLIFVSNNYSTITMDGVEKGYNFEQLIVFIFLSIIVGQLKSSWVTSSQMILEIRQGLINKYLTFVNLVNFKISDFNLICFSDFIFSFTFKLI